MALDRTITLGDDGAFSATAGDHVLTLTIDDACKIERWILVQSKTDGTHVEIVSLHPNLDAGLQAVAELAGWGLGRFRVVLPCDSHFIRPGEVPAASVMAAHGYVLVRLLTAFMMIEAPRYCDSEDLRMGVVQLMEGTSIIVGKVEAVDPEGDEGWCCDLIIPFDGYAKRENFIEIATSEVAFAGVDILDAVEPSEYDPVAANIAQVIQIFPELTSEAA